MGYFVVVEGLPAVGKTCLTEGLKEHLQEKYTLETTEEPNKCSFAYEDLKEILNNVKDADRWTQALAFAANRADHNRHKIKPFLSSGENRILICDRYYHSSLVYQSNHETTIEDLFSINRYAEIPNLTLFLDASVDKITQRLKSRKRNSERFHNNLGFWQKKYHTVVEMLRNNGQVIVTIDANKSIKSVRDAALEAINLYGPPWIQD